MGLLFSAFISIKDIAKTFQCKRYIFDCAYCKIYNVLYTNIRSLLAETNPYFNNNDNEFVFDGCDEFDV